MDERRPRVLTIGGLDPCAGAGITADARVLELHCVAPATLATALTVQNRHGLAEVVAVEPGLLARMLHSVLDDAPVDAVKTGLFATPESVAVVAAVLRGLGRVPVVVDPVLGATAGGWCAPADVRVALLRELLPLAAVVTPNRPELNVLAGDSPVHLLAAGAAAVLVKGGHGEGREVVDELLTCGGTQSYVHPRLSRGPIHGTGCALASALAARLARGQELAAAAGAAIAWIERCIAATPSRPGSLPEPLLLSSESTR